MTDPIDPHTEGVLIRHGLGKPRVRCMEGETFEQMVEREKREAFNRAAMARRDYIAALEDARRADDIIRHASGLFDDMDAACWADVPRAED